MALVGVRAPAPGFTRFCSNLDRHTDSGTLFGKPRVFDADGRYLTLLDLKGMAFGMVFNEKNELFVVARDHVIKYAVQAP